MEDENCMEEPPCDLRKPRIVPYKKYSETSPEYRTLVQFKTRSSETIAVLPNKVGCNRHLRHTASCLQRESGMHGDEGRAVPKGTLDSEGTEGCMKIELANWSTRLT